MILMIFSPYEEITPSPLERAGVRSNFFAPFAVSPFGGAGGGITVQTK